jgi:hypothetical protein
MKYNKLQLVFLLFATLCLSSFDGQKEPVSSRYKAFFGCSYTDISTIDANTFKQMMTQPLCAKDSSNTVYKVKSFTVTYAERGLYQDDEGLPIIVTDYSSDNFTGDTLNTLWKNNFNERLYKGDTVYFERVMCSNAEKRNFMCKTIKLIIR